MKKIKTENLTIEKLHPDLRKHKTKLDLGIEAISHPLIHMVFYHENMNSMINKQYEHKLMMVKKMKKDKDWNSYLFLHERPYRINAFYEIADKLTDNEYWSLLGSIYVDSENIWQNYDLWEECLGSSRGNKMSFMTEEELNYYNNLPEKLTVYRGCVKRVNEDGMSYSLSKEIAEFFAFRFNSKGIVKEKTVSKKDVFAYKNSRGEQEIIILPSNL